MPNLQKDGDPYTGEVFLSLDKRDFDRRIRVIEIIDGALIRKYRYVTITNGGDPALVGRRGRISARGLDKRWKKVSH